MTLCPLISCPPGSLPAETAPRSLLFPGGTASFRQVNQCCLSHPGDWGDCSVQTNPQLHVHPQHHTCAHNLCLLSLKSSIRASALTQPGAACVLSALPPHSVSSHLSRPPGPLSSSDGHQQPSTHTSTSGYSTFLQSASKRYSALERWGQM